jgi:acetyl-CoA acyltransferase 1
MDRCNRIIGHLAPTGSSEAKLQSGTSLSPQGVNGRADDIVIVRALRTAIGRARKGSFKDTHATDLLAAVLRGVSEGVDKKQIGDVVVGSVLAPGGFATQARMGMLLADFPVEVPVTTVNRQCSSGLQAFSNVAAAIKAGYYDMGIAAGVESMTNGSMGPESLGDVNEKVFDHDTARSCLTPMGITSENVAEKFNISREAQDRMAADSHAKALRAQAEGRFDAEIVPVTTMIEDKEGNEKEITVTKDDGPRAGSTVEKLGKLRLAFSQEGTTTAGNSSQVSDGAAAVLLCTRRKAEELKLPIMGAFRSFSVVGCDPEIMGIGPAVAIPPALEKAGLGINDIAVYEINEAFASQATYCVEKLNIPMEKVNPNGGAIALGHPLACTGARQIATLMNELKRSKGRYGVVSMCIGTGMGAAAVFENEQL